MFYYYDPNKVTSEQKEAAVKWLSIIEGNMLFKLTNEERDLLLSGFYAGWQAYLSSLQRTYK